MSASVRQCDPDVRIFCAGAACIAFRLPALLPFWRSASCFCAGKRGGGSVVHADKQVVPLVAKARATGSCSVARRLLMMLCASFSRCPASSRDAMSFYPWRIVRKGFFLRFLFFLCPFVRLKVVTDGALQVGFSFLPALRKSGRINGWPWFIPAPCKLAHGWYPVTRCHSCEKMAERRLNSAVYSLSEAHPPAVRCASIAANTEAGES